MEDAAPSGPWTIPLVLVVVDGVDIREEGQGFDGRLFPTLTLEEILGRFGEEDPDGEIAVMGESLDDVGELYCCDGATGAQEEMVLAVVDILVGNEGRGFAGGVTHGHCDSWVEHGINRHKVE